MPEDYNAAANNKNVKDALKLFLDDATDTLIGLEVDRRDTFAEAASRPIERKLTTKWITEDGTPSEAPPLLNEYEDQKATAEEQNMVSDTPYDQRARYIASPEIDSVRGEDGNIMTFAPDIFSTPLNQRQARAINLLDKDGNATERGKLFHGLSEAGMFDEAGVLTEKGRAYLVSDQDINEEENRWAYKIQFDDEVNRDGSDWNQIKTAVKNTVVDAGGGAVDLIWNGIQGFHYNGVSGSLGYASDKRPQELIDKTYANNLAIVETANSNLMDLAGTADVGSAKIGKGLYNVLGGEFGMQDLADDAMYAARQRQSKTRQDIANLEAGESMETIYGLEGIVDDVEEIKGRMGADEFDRRYRRGGAFSMFASDVTNLVSLGIATKVARLAPLSTRALLGAQRVMGRGLREQLKVGAQEVLVESLKGTIERGTRTVNQTTRFIEKASAAGADPVAIARGKQAAEIVGRATRITDEAKSLLPKAIADLDAATAARNSLTTLIPEKAANAFIKTMEVGRQARGLPAKTIGSILERAGDTVTKVDGAVTNFLTERGLNQAYTAAISAAGVAGVTVGSPIVGAIGATAAALKTGKMISNYGKLFKYVGKEMIQVRGQIPFWKRVAAHTAPGSFNRGIAHTFNVMDLGGVTSDVLRRTGRGIVAAAPTDLMFEYVSDGADMRPQTFMQAAAESLIIGGSGAAAGGAFMGTNSRMRELSIGDQLNLIQGMVDPVQKGLFNVLSPGNRNALGTYAIANPTLIYNFKDSGPSEYDPNTNTASINVRSNNPIKAVIAHETLHHTVIKNNMEGGLAALFFGDTVTNTTGGILRSKDGKFDPNFEEFKNAYYDRLGVAGMTDAEKNAIYPINKIGVEYFIEKHADQYASMAESGELGAISGSTELSRKFSSILETVLPRIPILKDLHFKSGGMIDKDGGWVTGNGLLDADGIKTDPITKKMFRDMNRRSSGLAPGQFEPLMSDKRDGGAQIILDPANAIDIELLHPLIRIDENNEPVLENGKPIALDKATLLERSLAGLTAKEVLRRKKAENYIPEKGEAHMDDAGEFQTGWLANDVLTEIFAKNRYNPEQKRILREINRLVRKGTGDRVVMINFPATTRNKADKVVYKAQGATIRDTVPVAITISKDGNLLFGLMSVTKLHENIQKRSQSRRGKKLYGGNVDLILQDTQAMMQFHKDGIDSIEHFKAKYGAVEATERKNFINTMFGLLNQKEQAVLNPMLIEDGIKSRDNVYRTYRADRVSKAVAMSPDEHPAMPFSYEATSQVKMPEQVMQMPEIAVVPERFTGSATDTDRRGRYVEPPGFFRKFNIDSYERGGRFFDAASGEDLTGKQYSTGSIDVSTGKPRLLVDNVTDATPSGNKFKTNLFKQKAGWKWTSENPPPTSTIVSVEGQGKHVYTLKANFEGGVELARYSEKKSEPRLRPTAYGEIKLGDKVGEISIRGKAHPVYDSIGIIPKAKEQVMQMPEDYRGQHTAPNRDGGSPIHDLANTYPDDIYSSKAERYYGHWGDARDAAAIRVIQSLKGKENASVKIYRAVPKYDAGANHTSISEANAKLSSLQRMAKSSPHLWDDPMFREQVNNLESQIPSKSKLAINSGDWVTTVKSYARDHGESALNGNYDILSKTVKAKDIFTNGDSIFEWGYDPETGASDPRYMPEAVDKDKFYSQLDRVISEKIPSRATPQQIMATIDPTRGSGVKADEIKWSGIEQALESLKKDGKVSKEDLLNYLRDEGNIKFKEVTLNDVTEDDIPQEYETKRQEEILRERAKEIADEDDIDPEEAYDLLVSDVSELQSAMEQAREEYLNKNKGLPTKFSQYTLPGGENYREVVLAMPAKPMTFEEYSDAYKAAAPGIDDSFIKERYPDYLEAAGDDLSKSNYTSSHFPDIPNYVAHMRTNERTDGDGNPGLFVEEFQADRHQEGRKRGYDTERGVDIATKEFNRIVKPSKDVDSKEMQELVLSTNPRMIEWVKESLGQDYDRIRELAMQDRQSVPDAPFRTTWPLQLFKRALRDAVDSKKDWIGWTVGETQNDRFDLSKQVGEIRHWKSDEEGYYGVQVIEPNGQTIMHEDEMISTDKLADLVGKDVAQRIVDGEGEDIGNTNARSLSGDNLKMGGSGMKGFYDNMLPKEIGKYVKQWGGKVEKTRLDTLEYADVGRNSGNGKYYLYDEKGNPLDKEYDTYDEAKAAGETPIWRIDITQQMRESVPQGQARYMPEKRQEIGEDMVVNEGDKDTLSVTQAVDKKGKPMWKGNKPVLVSVGYGLATAPNINKFAGNVENPSVEFLDNIPYNLNGAERGRVEALIKNGVVDQLANDMVEKTRIVLKDPAIAAGKGWYSRMRVKLLNALGEAGRELFSQFLGATSAQTPVDENFLQTVDAHEGMMSGRYNRHRKGYLTAIRAESEGKLNEEIVKSRAVKKTEDLISKLKSAIPSAPKAQRIPIYAEIKSLTELVGKPVDERTSAQRLRLYIVGNDLLPRRSNGAKFNANSGAVLKVISGVWLDNRESPKTPNFAGNLSGRTTQATIDIWAARFIRRMIYGGEGTPWRIQPKSEIGVSNEDFAFSQIIMQRAAEKLGMNPDDLQAILWFAEKDVWDKNKWTKNEGAKKSSFDDIFEIFFPAGKKPLTFEEGSSFIRETKALKNSVAKQEKEATLKAKAQSLGVSIAELNRIEKRNKSK